MEFGKNRTCAISAGIFPESEMVKVNGRWYHPKYMDDNIDEGVKVDTALINWYNNYLDDNPQRKASG